MHLVRTARQHATQSRIDIVRGKRPLPGKRIGLYGLSRPEVQAGRRCGTTIVDRIYKLHCATGTVSRDMERDRKSTRLNSSHLVISYAVFCLKKKKSVYSD